MASQTKRQSSADAWMTALGVLIGLDVAAVVGAAMLGNARFVTIGAAVFAFVAVGVAVRLNAITRRLPQTDAAASALAMNNRLIALAYLWGALAMQGLYTTTLTGLRWQHGWQYATLMLVLAVVAFVLARRLADPAEHVALLRLATPLGIAQSVAGGWVMGFLLVSGKLQSVRPDWYANQIFFQLALTVMLLGVISLRTHSALMRRQPARDQVNDP